MWVGPRKSIAHTLGFCNVSLNYFMRPLFVGSLLALPLGIGHGIPLCLLLILGAFYTRPKPPIREIPDQITYSSSAPMSLSSPLFVGLSNSALIAATASLAASSSASRLPVSAIAQIFTRCSLDNRVQTISEFLK